jgi:hypothetical protein
MSTDVTYLTTSSVCSSILWYLGRLTLEEEYKAGGRTLQIAALSVIKFLLNGHDDYEEDSVASRCKYRW